MDSFWARAHGCQADDCFELLRAFLQERQEILAVEAARFLGLELEAVQPLLQRLVEEGLAEAPEQASAWVYRYREAATTAA